MKHELNFVHDIVDWSVMTIIDVQGECSCGWRHGRGRKALPGRTVDTIIAELTALHDAQVAEE